MSIKLKVRSEFSKLKVTKVMIPHRVVIVNSSRATQNAIPVRFRLPFKQYEEIHVIRVTLK